jgi:nitroreductase
MNFFDVVRARQSVRAFAARPVETEKLQKILDAANRAPSAGNLQAYQIFVVTRSSILSSLVDASRGQAFLAQAPVVLVFCAEPGRASTRYAKRGTLLYCIQDATIACAYAQLAATALGLACVWVGAFDDAAVLNAIGASNDLRPIAVLPIGYAAEEPERTSRRAQSDLVRVVP